MSKGTREPLFKGLWPHGGRPAADLGVVPDRRADWSWDCRYWMAANGIDDSAEFDKAWANPKEELHLSPGAIVRKTTDPSWGQKIEIWYQWDEPKKPQPTVTVERIT